MSRFEIQKELLAKNVRIIKVMGKSKIKVDIEIKKMQSSVRQKAVEREIKSSENYERWKERKNKRERRRNAGRERERRNDKERSPDANARRKEREKEKARIENRRAARY